MDLEIAHQRKRNFVPICGDGCELIVVIISQYIHILNYLHRTPEANVMLRQFYLIKKKKKNAQTSIGIPTILGKLSKGYESLL